jgi:hypothetical protein
VVRAVPHRRRLGNGDRHYLRLRKVRTAAYTAENVQMRTSIQLSLLTAVVLLALGLFMVVFG